MRPVETQQNLFHVVNEHIRAFVDDPAEEDVGFLCECDDPACVSLVRLGARDYDGLRRHDDRRVLAAGHAPSERESLA